jgi:hypothetical protein
MKESEKERNAGASKEPGGRILALHLVMDPSLISPFAGILQEGFLTGALLGTSIKAFLQTQLGLPQDYVQRRVTTVFLDGKPVDQLDAAFIRSGAVLAISGAMPGVAGAAMRSGGFYGSLRGGITYREGSPGTPVEKGYVRIKLFNILIEEVGSAILARGVFIPSHELASLLARQQATFWVRCSSITLDGRTAEPSLFMTTAWAAGSDWVNLAIGTPGNG